MRAVKRICSVLGLVLVALMLVVPFTGCGSTDKSQSFFDSSNIEFATFEYNEEIDQTYAVWTGRLKNDTIYNFNSFSITFELYRDSELVGNETYNYNCLVKHGAEYTGNFTLYADGRIEAMEFDSWSANYVSFWDTYKIWFIVTIALVSIAAIIYIIVMIVQDLDLSDSFDAIVEFFEDYVWVVAFAVIPIAGTIWGIITAYWVPILIVLGGLIAFIIVALVAHLIKYIVECIADNIYFYGGGSDYSADEEDEEVFDPESENISDYIDDSDKLMLFTSAQLKKYCKEHGIKGYSALNKTQLTALICSTGSVSLDATIDTKVIGKKDIQKGTKIKFDDIAGLDEVKQAFKEKVVYAFEHKDLYEKYGKKVGGGILLYGLPGTGKTMFAEAASNETDSLFIPIKCSDIKSKWYGESEANVKKIFDKARRAKKAIIFFDEFEALGAKRTDNGENGNNDLVPQILAEMQGIGSTVENNVIVVIAATNKPWAIDSAFLRPGRFDEKIYIPLPDFEARKKLFEIKLRAVPQDNLDYVYLARITDGFNGADIGAFCDKLKMAAINKSIMNKLECPVSMDDVEQVKKLIRSSVSQDDVEQLMAFKNRF